MINIGNNSIENILVGDTLVDRVYLGVDIVWEHSLPSVRNYLKFTALESGTFTLTIPANVTATHLTSVSYSLDNGATWVTTQNSSSAVTITTPSIAQGGTVLWKGSGTQTAVGQNNGQYSTFSSTGNFRCSGNIMSLLYEDDFEDRITLTKTYCLCRIFYQCATITTMPEIPATTLTSNCYREMFYNCTSLTQANKLPATSLADRCYVNMFYGCSSLANIPANMLPATTLSDYCYYQMFYGCNSITAAPELPARTLANTCYQRMFVLCSALRFIKAMFITIPSGSSSLMDWVNGVSSTGTFVKNIEATWNISGRNGIPTGWTVVYADS